LKEAPNRGVDLAHDAAAARKAFPLPAAATSGRLGKLPCASGRLRHTPKFLVDITATELVEMATYFPYVDVPMEFLPFAGKADSGKRIYRKYGSEADNAAWFDAALKFVGPVVSPGGAAMYARVSRAAVNKRLNSGKLTAFLSMP
jgi:hypothetical protein